MNDKPLGAPTAITHDLNQVRREAPLTVPSEPPASPPAFQWEEWYAAVGGRSIRPDEVNTYLKLIREEQCLRFEGPVARERQPFASPEEAASHLKQKAV